MANEARQLYQKLIKGGMSREEAFFAVIDHFNRLHWHDRDRCNERLVRLEKAESA